MKLVRRLLFVICLCGLLCLTAFAGDSSELSAQWFGTDGNDGSVLALDSLNEEAPQIDALVDEYFVQREAVFNTQTQVHRGGTTLLSEETERAALVADLESRINSVITGAKVTSFITALEETENGYVAKVYEWTFFDYDDLSDGVGGSDTAGFGVEHTMTFAYNGSGELELMSDVYTESDVLTGVLPENTSEAELAIPEAEAQDVLSAVTYDADYDAVKSAIYANKWVTQEDMEGGKDPSYYNPAYRNFASSGGDCANYVSQCLYAGGMDMVTSGAYPWYYKSYSSYTYAWTHCYYQTNHFKSRGNYVANPTDADVFPGTALYYPSYSHVTICVGHNSAGKPVINGHTSDRYRVPWDYSKETVSYVIQMTQTVIEDMTFTPDAVIALKDFSLPLYAHYQDTKAAATMTLTKGTQFSIITSFQIAGVTWFAYEETGTGTVYYGKLVDGTCLMSDLPDPSVTIPASVTTNDFMTISATLPNDAVAKATVTFTDSKGNAVSKKMTCSGGAAQITVDCQDFAPGMLKVTVKCTGEIWPELSAACTVTVLERTVASAYDGETLLWELNKTTGVMVLYGPEEITSADYLRFATKIKVLQVSPSIKTLPQNPLAGCTVLTTVYGSQAALRTAAEALGAEFVTMYFWDVLPDRWSYGEINTAFENGLVNGTGNDLFQPLTTMNRGSFVLILSRMAGVDAAYEADMTFTDVASDMYYAKAIAWAAEKGIVNGITAQTFAPEAIITREQAATIISRYLEVMGLTLPDVEEPAIDFYDMDLIGDWARDHVETLRQKGIINGRGDGCFDPAAELTREEATALLLRVYLACDGAGDDSGAGTENTPETDGDSKPEETPDAGTAPDETPDNEPEPDETPVTGGTPEVSPLPDDGTDEGGTNDGLDEELQNLLSEQVSAYSGSWGIYYKNLKTGEQAEVGDGAMVAASLIKLFVAGAYCEAVELGEIEDTQSANLKMMITQSSNTACNTIIDVLGNGSTSAGMAKVNAFAKAFGANNSVLNRKMLASGTENYTSPGDCGLVLEAIMNGTFVSESASKLLLGYLEAQTRTTKIPAGVPSGTKTANKTGELSAVENDAAIVWSPNGTYILCVMSADWNSAATARSNIQKISAAVYDYLN